MYQFKTLSGSGTYTTNYSPKEISKLFQFDCMDMDGQSKVISSEDVDFKTFEFIN